MSGRGKGGKWYKMFLVMTTFVPGSDTEVVVKHEARKLLSGKGSVTVGQLSRALHLK